MALSEREVAAWPKTSYSGNGNIDYVEVATLRKATYSANDGANCVEAAIQRKATSSANSGANCAEVGVAARGRVLVRDTTDRDGAVLDLPAGAWDRFTASLR